MIGRREGKGQICISYNPRNANHRHLRMQICPAFVDETGVLNGSLKEQPVYGIGILVIPEPRLITDSFYKLHFNFVRTKATQRKELRKLILNEESLPTMAELDKLMWATRHHEYKFSEVTSHNLQQYIDLVNLYFSFPGLEFHACWLTGSIRDSIWRGGVPTLGAHM